MEEDLQFAMGGRIEVPHPLQDLAGGLRDDKTALDRKESIRAHGRAGRGLDLAPGQADEVDLAEDGELGQLADGIGRASG